MKRMKELGIKFNLKQVRDVEKLTQIVLAMKVGGKRVRIYTRLRVKPKHWSKCHYRCIGSPYLNERERMALEQVNEQLDMLVTWLYEADTQRAETGHELDEKTIREVVEYVKKGSKPDRSPMVVMRELLAGYEQEINRRGRKGVAGSRRAYNTAISRLEAFDRQRAHPIESFDEFNERLFDEFKSYLYACTYGKKRLHYTKNTIVNTLKVIKNLLHRAYDQRLLRDDSFKRVETVLPADVSDQTYLNREEVKRLADVKTYTREEREVRDMFVIACHTALRFSDIQQLGQATFEKETIKLYQQKTKDEVLIPIMKEIVPLLNHYREVGFPRLRRRKVAGILRTLASRCHIEEPFTKREERGGEVVITVGPKHRFINFHTARRSCITNLYLDGYAAQFIMSISGHHSTQSFMRYVRASGKEVYDRLIEQFKKRKAI